MKKGLFVWAMLLVLSIILPIVPAEATVAISYSLEDLGAGRWKAIYQVDNLDESFGIELFTIYYDYGLYDALQIETPLPLASQWDQDARNPLLIGPLPFPGLYDVQAKSGGISAGQSLSGFAISFDWLGGGIPIRDQRFEVYEDSDNLQSVRVGVAAYIPEPATLLLLAAGAFLTYQRKSRRH